MTTHNLVITLLSDATFGRGDGIAGLVDEEIEHDAATGLPFIRGRVLRGLLVEECANILHGYTHATNKNAAIEERLTEAAKWLFGVSGSAITAAGHLHVGHAMLPDKLRHNITLQVKAEMLQPADVLESLTTIRRQTSMNEAGAPDAGSLRSMRVLLRGDGKAATQRYNLTAALTFDAEPEPDVLALLAACAASVRRGGTGRNRGRGRLKVTFTGCEVKAFEALLANKLEGATQ